MITVTSSSAMAERLCDACCSTVILFLEKGASPTNHCWCQKTKSDCPFVWYQNIRSALFGFVTKHTCDRQMDRLSGLWVTPKTVLTQLHHAVKTITRNFPIIITKIKLESGVITITQTQTKLWWYSGDDLGTWQMPYYSSNTNEAAVHW